MLTRPSSSSNTGALYRQPLGALVSSSLRANGTGPMRQHVERRLVAILAADVAGYSKLMSADEEGTLTSLKAHRRTLSDPKIKQHGRIFKTTGDGILVEFPSAVDAVKMCRRNSARDGRAQFESQS
jgi:class 3 adenylate cyclase